jgi:hypothetical protein
VKSRRLQWAGHVAMMGDKEYIQHVHVEIFGKWSFGILEK